MVIGALSCSRRSTAQCGTPPVYGFDANRATRTDKPIGWREAGSQAKIIQLPMKPDKQGRLDSTLYSFPSLTIRV
jgi:hypothetical protein